MSQNQDPIYIFCGVENDMMDGYTAFVKIGSLPTGDDAVSIANQMYDMVVARFGENANHQNINYDEPKIILNVIPFKK
jgi:hypothetical protein